MSGVIPELEKHMELYGLYLSRPHGDSSVAIPMWTPCMRNLSPVLTKLNKPMWDSPDQFVDRFREQQKVASQFKSPETTESKREKLKL